MGYCLHSFFAILSVRYRKFRALDRNANSKQYPNLFFREIYLLEGGYKAFYEADGNKV